MGERGGVRKGAGRKKLPDCQKRRQMNIKVNDAERKAVRELLKQMRKSNTDD